MDSVGVNDIATEQPHEGAARNTCGADRHAWSFVYVFFSNGTPFDSPNRSEPCSPL